MLLFIKEFVVIKYIYVSEREKEREEQLAA